MSNVVSYCWNTFIKYPGNSIIFFILFLAAGCDQRASIVPEERSSSNVPLNGAVSEETKGDVGSNSSLGASSIDSGDLIKEANSWEDRLLNMTSEEQKYLTEVNENYFGLFAFGSQEEQRKLMLYGFPMPEEWIAASKLNDDQLRELAENGNRTAQYIYTDRLVSSFEQLEQRSAAGPRDVEVVNELDRLKVEAGAQASTALRFYPSPFAAYLKGRTDAVTLGSLAPMAAGMALAHQLGDDRAMDYLYRLSRSKSDIDLHLVFTAYNSMSKMAKHDQ
jgi:hypothetical protein